MSERTESIRCRREQQMWDWALAQTGKFTLDEVWRGTKVPYSFAAVELLRWWRAGYLERWAEILQEWVRAEHPLSPVPRSHRALYRWIND